MTPIKKITAVDLADLIRDLDDRQIGEVVKIVNGPADHETLAKLDDLLDCHGREDVSVDTDGTIHNDASGDRMSFAYLNTGDLYTPTIAFFDGDHIITTYDDLRERLESLDATEPGSTPDDFDPEITLAAGDVVVRMQYRDGGGSDCRGDYRFEIAANGETHYGDGLQSPRMGFDLAADSIEAYQAMACCMLSFITTDDESADCRAPESMQSELEATQCEVSWANDGEDDPSNWAVVDHDSMESTLRALIAHKIADGMDASEIDDIEDRGDGEFEIDGETWRVFDDADADAAAVEYVWASVWAFRSEFLAAHVAGGTVVANAMSNVQRDECEGANEAIQALIMAGSGKDHFCRDAIKADGRGHFLSGYDGEECEHEIDGVLYYLYRTN